MRERVGQQSVEHVRDGLGFVFPGDKQLKMSRLTLSHDGDLYLGLTLLVNTA